MTDPRPISIRRIEGVYILRIGSEAIQLSRDETRELLHKLLDVLQADLGTKRRPN